MARSRSVPPAQEVISPPLPSPDLPEGSESLWATDPGGLTRADVEHAGVAERPVFPVLRWNVPLPMSVRSLGHRNFRLFWTGQLISLVGTWMQTIARGWLVLELTHSPLWLGVVGFATSFPVLLLSLWGGLLADRFPKRNLIIVTQTLNMATAFSLGLLTITGLVQVWHIVAISLVAGVVFAFDAPARQAFVIEMVGKEDVVNAVALNSAIFNGARVMGPAIGAVVLAWAGPGLAFMLNGVSYVAVIYGLVLMRVAPAVAASRSGGSVHQIAEGLRYVARHETIAVLAGLVGVISLFAFPYTTLMPIFADSILHVGSQGYGTLMMFTGIGSLAGALSLAFQSSRPGVRRGRIVLFGALGMPIFLAAFSSSTNYALSLALLTGVGWTMISVNATVNSIIQTLVPDELRGRVMGVYSLMAVGIAPLGSLQAGLIADTLGSPAAVLIGSVVTASAVVWILLVRRVAFNVH